MLLGEDALHPPHAQRDSVERVVAVEPAGKLSREEGVDRLQPACLAHRRALEVLDDVEAADLPVPVDVQTEGESDALRESGAKEEAEPHADDEQRRACRRADGHRW